MMRVQSHFVSATHSRMRTFRRLAVGLLVGGVFVAMPRDALPSQVISLGLAPVRGGQYPAGVAETTANRIGVRNSKRADDRRLAVFFRCAEHAQQLGGASPLPNLMVVKG